MTLLAFDIGQDWFGFDVFVVLIIASPVLIAVALMLVVFVFHRMLWPKSKPRQPGDSLQRTD